MALSPFLYSDTNKRYHTFDYDMRRRFQNKTAVVPLDAGLTCPNRDGAKGTGGCIYCSGRGSGDFVASAADGLQIEERLRQQFDEGKKPLEKKWAAPNWIGYFQAFTNTYGPLPYLRRCWETVISFPGVVGLSIATRADCLEPQVMELLKELNRETFLVVELGLQTVHDRTADRICRGHSYGEFLEGYRRLQEAGIRTGLHLINGLPGESREDMMESVEAAAALQPYSLKLHLLHVLEGTVLADWYRAGQVPLMELTEYVELICDQLERIPPEVVIQRLTGDGPKDQLLAPLWSRNKREVLNRIDQELVRRNSWQGKKA